METQTKILTPDEIYQIFIAAMTDKKPLPPAGWCASKLDEEVLTATREYEPDAFLRHKDALETSLFYLVDFAVRMPERVDLTENNERVKGMCGKLAAEIEKITFAPDEVISAHGKLKAWLKAILAVQTCFIYTEETDRYLAEQEAAKRARRAAAPPKTNSLFDAKVRAEKWQSDLAKNIFQKAVGKSPVQTSEKSSEQPSLF